jgi:transposase-like protein
MKLNDEQKIEIVKRYRSGESSVKLSKEYGITRQGILGILKVRNVNIRDNNGK